MPQFNVYQYDEVSGPRVTAARRVTFIRLAPAALLGTIDAPAGCTITTAVSAAALCVPADPRPYHLPVVLDAEAAVAEAMAGRLGLSWTPAKFPSRV